MIYELTRPLAKLGLSVYFRKIYFSNSVNIPAGKAVILAANHPTAVIEPCMLASWLERPLSFLARGDLYVKSPFFRFLYKLYHIVPVFRLIDTGYENVTRNYETFESCYAALEARKVVMILVEGKTIHEKRLRPLKKGTARIVFGSLEKYGDQDIHIVPVGVNFSNADKFRGIAMYDFGTPIRVSEFHETYRQDANKAISEITKEVAKRLRERVIHIENPEDDELAEQLLEFIRYETEATFWPVTEYQNEVLKTQISTVEKLNQLGQEQKESLASALNDYKNLLYAEKLTDFGVLHPKKRSLGKTAIYIFGWLPASIGKLLNWPPLALGDYLGNRLAPAIEFRASIAGISGTLAWIIYFLALFSTIWSVWDFATALMTLLLPILGYFYLFHSEVSVQWNRKNEAYKAGNSILENLLKARDNWKMKLE